MKRIVIFCDGTWNSPEQGFSTNVLKMAQAVKPEVNGTEQIVFYDWGVGTDQHKLAGGITGFGIDKNIMDCYRFIIHNFNPGDKLFFFGFSRGAYTVRSLAGFIRNCGLLKRMFAVKISEGYDLYRNRNVDSHPKSEQATQFRQKYAIEDLTYIEFIGAWDTVGALGIPIPYLGSLGENEYRFHDTEPSKIILHARHAVSIDENRRHFKPTLWDNKAEIDIKQVWFAGVHSDIGGGYEQTGLSDNAMDWMIHESKDFGLEFEDHLLFSIKPDHLDVQHNERKGFYLVEKKYNREVVGPIHISAKRRWDVNAHDYQTTSTSLKRFLEANNSVWDGIEIVE